MDADGICPIAGGIAGFVGNPGEIIMVRMQGDKGKPPEKRFNYKHSIDALFRVCLSFLSFLSTPFPFII
jgi:hypothetical protein